MIKHEQSLNLTHNELNRAKERVSELETRLHSVSVERDMLKSSQERLNREHELLVQESSSRSSIASSIEMLRANFERVDRENKATLTQKIEQLERDNAIQRKQIEQTEEQHAVIVKSWQSQHERAAQQLERQIAECEQLKSQLGELKVQHESLQQKYSECDAKLHSHELIVQMSRNSKSSSAISHLTHLEEESKELQSKLALADKEIVSLKIQLEETKAHIKQYKSIADTMEKTSRETTEANDKLKQVLEERIQELTDTLTRLQTQCQETLEEKSEREARFQIERAEFEETINVLEQTKETLGGELNSTRRHLENNVKILQERTESRDEYVAKMAVLEETSRELSERWASVERELTDRCAELSLVRQTLQASEAELERERSSGREVRGALQDSEAIIRANMDSLKVKMIFQFNKKTLSY